MSGDHERPWLTDAELHALGVQIGVGVLVSRYARIVGDPRRLWLGDGTRIDDFVSLIVDGQHSMMLRANVHVGTGSSLHGGAGILIRRNAHLSAGVRVFSVSDDFTGRGENLYGTVKIGRDCVVGANAVLLPGAVMENGATLGACSVARGKLWEWSVYAGAPARFIESRTRKQ